VALAAAVTAASAAAGLLAAGCFPVAVCCWLFSVVAAAVAADATPKKDSMHAELV